MSVSPMYTGDGNQQLWVLDNVLSLPGKANDLHKMFFDTNKNKYISVLFSKSTSIYRILYKKCTTKKKKKTKKTNTLAVVLMHNWLYSCS